MMDLKACATIGDLESILINEDEKPRPMTYELLKGITNNFSHDLEIGRGGHAVVYKGFVGNRTVAVKKLLMAPDKVRLFDREVISLVKKTKHKNVIRCLGYCSNTGWYAIQYEDKYVMAEEDSRLLCFPYLPNGSLDKYITDPSCGLEWDQRYQIINGVCHGLHRLHQDDIFHLDLKPENILLDDDMVPKIADFGISKCLDDENGMNVRTDSRRGTRPYLPREFIDSGVVTNKFDLYSLGVIIIEILTGARCQDIDEVKVLESWISRLGESRTSAQLDQIEACARLSIECSNENPDRRPLNIGHIINRLEETGSIQETQESGSQLHVHPTVLVFDLQPCKLIPCTLKLTNDTDKHMAFKLGTAESVDWSGHFKMRVPVYGTVLARSTYTLILTVLEERRVPDKRFCDLILQSRAIADNSRMFNGKDEYEEFLRNKAENVVKLKAFLSQKKKGRRSVSEPTGTGIRILSMEKQWATLLSMDAHPTKPWIITGHAFGHIRIWNHEAQRLQYSFKVSQGSVHSVKFIVGNGKQWFISSSAEGLIHVYSYETKMQKVKSFRAHDGVSISLAVHPALPYVLSSTCSSAGWLQKKLWGVDNERKPIRTFEEEYVNFAREFVYQVAFDPEDTNRFASASTSAVKVWSIADDSPESNYTLSTGFIGDVTFLEFFTRDDQQYLVIIDSYGVEAKIWDMQKKKQYVPETSMSSFFAHPSLPILLTRSSPGTCRFWSPKDFRCEGVLDYGQGGIVRGTACLMGSKRRFVIGQETAVTILDIGDDEKYQESRDSSQPQLCPDTRPEDTSSEVLLHVHPLNLHFLFQEGKLIPCSLHLENVTDEHVAFRLSGQGGMSWKWPFARMPLSGIVPSKSTYTLVVTMEELSNDDLQQERDYNLILHSSISGDRYIYTFASQSECDQFFGDAKETGNAVHEAKLKAVLSLREQTMSENGSTGEDDVIQPSINIWGLFRPAKEISGVTCSLDADPTESWIITGHRKGDVSIWKCGTQRMVSSINTWEEKGLPRHTVDSKHDDVYSVKFITRKGWFVAGTYDGFIHVYTYGTRMDSIKRFKAHSSGIKHSGIYSSRALVVHRTQPFVLSTFEEIKLWNWDKDWICEKTFQREHTGSISQVVFNPKDTDTFFASASSDHTIKLWSKKYFESKDTLHGHFDKVNCLDFFTYNGQQYLISGSQDCTAKIWDLQDNTCVGTMDVFMSPVLSVISLRPDTPYIITGLNDGTVHLWNFANFSPELVLPCLERIVNIGCSGPVRTLCLMGSKRVVIEQAGQISIMDIDTISEASSSALSTDQLIQVDPPELHVPSVAQEVSSTMKISNTTDHHVAFSIWSANYNALPNKGVLSPKSTQQVVVTRTAQEWVPVDLMLEEVVYVKGTTVFEGIRSPDVTDNMFDETKTSQFVQSVNIAVVLVPSEIIHKARSLRWALDVHPTMPWIMMTQGDYHVRIWNYETRKEKPIAIKGREVTSSKFIAHKQWIMAGCSSGLIYVYGYDPKKKNPVKKIRVLRGHSNAVNSLAVHATDPCVLSASEDGKILVWDYENEWKLLKTFYVKSPVDHVAFSPRDTNMFASAQDKIVKIWDWHSDDYKLILSGHTDYVVCLDFFSQGDKIYMITGSHDKTAKIWDCKTGSCVQTLEGHTDVVNVVICHPDLLILITGSSNGSVRLWDWSPCSTMFRYELKFNLGEVYAIASLKGSTWIAIGNETGLALIDLEGKKDGDVKSTVMITDSKNDTYRNMKDLSPSASSSEVQKVSSIVAWETIYKVKSASSIDVHPTETWMVTTTNKFVHIWDYHTKEVKRTIGTKGVKVRLAKFIAHKKWIIGGATSGLIFVYDYDSKKEIRQVLCNHTEPIKSLAIHETEPFVLSASVDGKILLWFYDNPNDLHLMNTFDAKSRGLAQVVFNPKDANMFASAQGKTVKIWDRWHDECQHTLDGHSHQIECFDYFSGGDSDKLYIITGSRDKTAKIWDCENASCVQTLEGHVGPVRAVCYHPDLSLLITWCSDGSIRLWNSTTFRLEHTLNFDDLGSVSFVACLKGSKRIAIGNKKGLALVDIDTEDKKDGNVESVAIIDSKNDTSPIMEEKGAPADFTIKEVVTVKSAVVEESFKSTDATDDMFKTETGRDVHHVDLVVVSVDTETIYKIKSACTIDVHPTDPWMVIVTQGGKTILIWDYRTKEVKWTIQIKGVKASLAKFIAYDRPNRKQWIVAGTTSGLLYVYDCGDSRKEPSLLHNSKQHSKSITSLAVHATKPRVLSASMDGKILLWDYANDWNLVKAFDSKTQCLKQVAFNPCDPDMFATAQDDTVKVWSLDHGERRDLTLSGHSGQIECLDYCTRGDEPYRPYVITGSRDNTAKIWDNKNASCVQTLEGHAGHVTIIRYHPGLSMLITGSRDGSIRLWNSTTFRLVRELKFDLGYLSSVACLKGSTRIAIGYEKGLVLADISTQKTRAS